MTEFKAHIALSDILYLADSREIRINPQAIGKGGEGNVYAVINPPQFKGMVAKVYHPQERKKEREEKLKHMIQNPPTQTENQTLMWAKELIYQGGEFVGYLMPQAPGEYDLSVLSALSLSKKLDESWQEKYSRKHIEGIHNRLKIAYNLCYALQLLHQSDRYVMVDLKPENIRVSLNGQISLLDLDSIEIIQEGRLLFPAEKLSVEYSPPERQDLNHRTERIEESWDRFSLAIIIYKILFGLHPFTGTGKNIYANLVTYAEKIQAGLFPHGSKKDEFSVIPKPHDNFVALPISLQKLFTDTFDQGIANPELRPHLSKWMAELKKAKVSEKHYESPIKLPLRRANVHIAFQKEGLKVEKTVLNSGYSNSAIIWINLINLIHIFDFTDVNGIFIILFFVLASGLALTMGLKYAEEISFNTQAKKLMIHFKSIYKKRITKEYPLDKISTTFGFEKKRKRVLRIFKKNTFNNRIEIARFVILEDGTNEAVVKDMVKQLRLIGVNVDRPGSQSL